MKKKFHLPVETDILSTHVQDGWWEMSPKKCLPKSRASSELCELVTFSTIVLFSVRWRCSPLIGPQLGVREGGWGGEGGGVHIHTSLGKVDKT